MSKKAQVKNERSDYQQRLEMAQKAANIDIFDLDLASNKYHWFPPEREIDLRGRSKTKRTILPEDRKKVNDFVVQAIKHKKKNYVVEYRLREKDKSIHWAQARAEVFYNSKGRAVRIVGVNTDITERKGLEGSKFMLAAIVDSSEEAIIGKTLEGVITNWNKGAEKMYGYSPEEVVGKHVNVLAPDTRKTEADVLMKIIRQGKAVDHWETERQKKDGSVFPVSMTVSPVRDSLGKIIGASTIGRDISTRKQYESNLKFLAQASEILSSSLDYQTTLNSMAKLACPFIADWCTVEMLNDKGEIELVAVAHKDPEKIKWARELREKYPVSKDSATGVPKVIRTEKSEFYPVITPEMLRAGIKNTEQLKLALKIGFTSVIVVPLKSQGKVVGGITLVTAESKRRFSLEDLTMAEQLGTRASLAIENARLYQAVQQEQRRMHHLLANVPGVVWEAWGKPDESQQRVDFVSKYVERMLGYTTEEWLKIPNFWLSIVHPEDRERAAAEAKTIGNNGKIGRSRFRWVRKDGTAVWVESQTFVIKDRGGKPIGTRGVTMDINAWVEIERRKDEFISMASHELKTPLTSIKVFTQILQNIFQEKKEEMALKHLGKMNEQIDKLAHLVSDLLDVSKIQAGKLDLSRKPFSLEELVSESVENLQPTTDHKIKVIGVAKKKVMGDRDRVYQVMINLLTNAIKYSPQARKVNINLNGSAECAVVAVRDFGVGIGSEHQEKIFDRFYRVYDNSDRTFPGLGMGLYISSEIIKRHGGKMWVKSQPQRGSTFYFSLPYE